MASRVNRKTVTTCKVCQEDNVDHTHVFEKCPRAQAVWDNVNLHLFLDYHIEVEASFNDVLNPGQLSHPATAIVDALAGITVHELWIDYCNYMHDRGELPPADKVSHAIHAHFRLTVMSELHLLKSDLAWWNRKFVFRPSLCGNDEVEEIITSLKTRIGTFEGLLVGGLTDELVSLAPYSNESVIVFID